MHVVNTVIARPENRVVPLGILIVRVAALIALFASGALLVEYRGPFATYCSARSGCDEIRRSEWSHVAIGGDTDVSVPAIGVVAFAMLLGVSLAHHSRVGRWLTVLGGLAAGGLGVALVLVQGAIIGAYCRLCVVADVAGVCAALGAGLVLPRRGGEVGEVLRPWAWLAIAVVVAVAPALWPSVGAVAQVPDAIRAHQQPGMINVVAFSDVRCPHCRVLARRLDELEPEFPGLVHRVDVMVSLDRGPGPREAARAHVCADLLGQGRRMREALFDATRCDAVELAAIARRIGLDPDAFDRCVAAPSTDARVEQALHALRVGGYEGLPTLYVGHRRIVGLPSADVLRLAFAQAADGAERRGIALPTYVALVALAVLAVWWSGSTHRAGARGRS